MCRPGACNSGLLQRTALFRHLQDQNKETPILKFQMDNANADNAKRLGNELTRIINAKVLSLRRVSRAFDGDPAFMPKNAVSLGGDTA